MMSETEQPAAGRPTAAQPAAEESAHNGLGGQQPAADQLPAGQPVEAEVVPAPRRRHSPWRTIIELPLLLLLLAILGFVVWMRFTPQGEQMEVAWREYLGFEAGATEAELAAAEQLRQRGVQVITEPPGDHVTSINFKPAFAGKPVDEDCLRLLANFPEVVSIGLAETQLADEQLRYLQGLGKLASLHLGGTPIGDAGLANLQGLPELTVLHLFGTRVSNAGLKHLAQHRELRILDLRNTRVTDAGLKDLAPLEDLEHLLLSGEQITDEGLKHLVALKGLGRLTAIGCKVTQEGIEQLRRALPRHPQVEF